MGQFSSRDIPITDISTVDPLIKPTSGPDDFGLIKQVGLLTGERIFATLMRINDYDRLYYR